MPTPAPWRTPLVRCRPSDARSGAGAKTAERWGWNEGH